MSRQRLTSRTAFDTSKVAAGEEGKKWVEPYDQNDTNHGKNDPDIDQYAEGDPEAWGEGVNKDNPAKDDSKRIETGHAPLVDKHAASEAIASARQLETRAVKCIIASQRMLPGAPDELIEKQASVLLQLPESGINSILDNQSSFAKMIAKAASDVAEDTEEKKEEPEKDEVPEEKEEKEASEGEVPEFLKKDKEDKEESEKKDDDSEDDSEEEKEEGTEKEANQNDPKAFYTGDSAADVEGAKPGKDKQEGKSEGKSVKASDESLLDQIFSTSVAGPKKGASKLSGMVKKQASESDPLSSLWGTAPDVSRHFQ